jgi:cupin 2 domain-containing protein
MKIQNLFDLIPQPVKDEFVEAFIDKKNVRVERIVSHGHTSPPDFWYDQDENEWVVVVAGGARLRFDDGDEVALGRGDHVIIPAHRKHRVEWTAPGEDTVWVAVFYRDR